MFETLSHDVRHAFRALRRSPTFALTAILTLTLTLGINIGLFSTLNALAFRRLPVPKPAELVRLSTSFRTGQEVPFSFPMFRELARRQTAIRSLIGWTDTGRTVDLHGTLTTARVTAVSGNYFSELGVVPAAGRVLQPDDVNLETFTSNAVAVLGQGFWQRHFGGSSSAMGTVIRVDGTPFTIVGVAPRGFKGFGLMAESDITVPLTASTIVAPTNYSQAGLLWMRIAGRLQAGVTFEQGRAQLEAIWPAIKADIIPPTHAGAQRENFLTLPLRLDSLAGGHEPYLQGFTTPLFALQGLALLTLVIGCLNLASLTLRRVAAHANERAIRIALGASGWQAVRHVLVESGVVALIAAICALPIGLWGSAAVSRMLLPESPVPLSLNTGADARVVGFASTLMAMTVLLFGWLPAWRTTRREPSVVLQSHARSVTVSSRLLRVMVVAQLSLSVVLLTNAGLLIRSLQRVLSVDLGFESRDSVRALFMPRPGVKERPSDESYYPLLIERVGALTGARSVAISANPPANGGFRELVSPMGWEPFDGISAVFNAVTPGFFETLGIRVLLGRDVSWEDRAEAPRVAILTRSLTDRLFPKNDPIGQRIRIGTQPYRQDIEVVGVVADARVYDLKDEQSYVAYVPKLQNVVLNPGGWLIVHGRIDEPSLHAAVQSAGPDFIQRTDPLPNAFSEAITFDRVTALLAGVFGLATVLLAAIGVGGLFAYTAVLRAKEIAIRLALGGEPRTIVTSVLREGLLIVLLGTVVGAFISLFASEPIRRLLYGVGPRDPVVIVGVPVVLAVVALFACLVPAVRASRTDPTLGLRVE